VGVVAGHQYEISDRNDEVKVVGMPFENRGTCWNPDLHHVLVSSTGPLFDTGMIVSKLVCIREVSNYGELFIYQVQIVFLVINIFQKINNPFSGVIFEQALQ